VRLKKTCVVYSDNGNNGDGHIGCPEYEGGPISSIPAIYAVRHTVDPDSMSTFLINRDGFEHHFLNGAEKMFQKRSIKSEDSARIMNDSGSIARRRV
jgi:hypothetical protein